LVIEPAIRGGKLVIELPMNDRHPKVCMFLLNNFAFDSRVEREASTLVAAGFDVTVIALRYGGLPAHEERNGVTIKRIGWGREQLENLPLVVMILVAPFRLIWFLARWSYNQLSRLLGFVYGLLLQPLSWLRRSLRDLLHVVWDVSASWAGEEAKGGLLSRIAYGVIRVVRKTSRFVTRSIRYSARAVRRGMRRSYLRARRAVRVTGRNLAKRAVPLWLARAGAAEGADIYHANDMNVLFAAYLAARVTGARLVYDSHELWIDRNVREGLSEREKARIKRDEGFLIKRVDAAMTVNRSIAVELANMYGVPEPYVVMNCPSYVDVGEVRSRRNGHIPRRPDRRVLLYVGRISFNRGIEPLIEAIVQLNDVDLVLMGNGNPDYLEWLGEYASDWDITQAVRIVDPVPPHEVVPTASQADAGMVLFQNTCLSYYYSLPTKIFECIHAGLPVIVSDFPEMANIVREYDIGIACDPADPAAIAEAVCELFADPVRYDQMRENTRAAARVFNWENEGAKLVKVYQGLAADTGGLT
jgi:glycosyltransferase involved in cell wall biosynthesis